MNNDPTFVLALDTDWVPQFVLDFVLNQIREYDLAVTVFCTTPYSLPDRKDVETALHPNFMADSTQGDSEAGCLAYLKGLYPEAVGSRSHRLFWHAGLKPLFQKNGILYDASLACPLQRGLMPYDMFGFIRFPVWWSDGYHLLSGRTPSVMDLPGQDGPGLKAIVFHPIHIYCNTRDLDQTRRALNGMDLANATSSDLEPARCGGHGVESFFQAALKKLSRHRTTTFRDIATKNRL